MRYFTLRSFYLLLLIISQFPPIYVISQSINTNALVKIGTVLIFLFIQLSPKYRNIQTKLILQHKTLFIIILINLFAATFSITFSNNIYSFLKEYQNHIFGYIFFFISIFYKKGLKIKQTKIILLFIFCLILNFLWTSYIYLFPHIFFQHAYNYIHSGYVDLIKVNAERARVYYESYDEVLVPLLLTRFTNQKSSSVKWIAILLIGFFSFISGARTRLLMFVVSCLSSVFIFKNKSKKVVLLVFSLIVAVVIIGITIQQNISYQSQNVINRILLEEESDVATITSRFSMWRESIQMLLSSPIFGVGLGNFYDNLNKDLPRTGVISRLTKFNIEQSTQHPHNVFFGVMAMMGGLGLASYIMLIGYFLYQDILKWKRSTYHKALIIGFWTLYMYALFNPPVTVKYQVLFWFFRVSLI